MSPDPRLHRAVSFICALPPSHPCLLLNNTEGFFLPAQDLPWQQGLETAARSLGGGRWKAAAGSQHGSPPGSLHLKLLQEGKTQGGAGVAAFGGCLPSPLSMAGLFFIGKKHQSLEALVRFLPWSYRCFQTSWWFGLQCFGLMVVWKRYLSKRCRTSILELGFFFWVGGWYVLQSHLLLRGGSEKHLFDMLMRENNWSSGSYTSLPRGSMYPRAALHTAQYKNHKLP